MAHCAQQIFGQKWILVIKQPFVRRLGAFIEWGRRKRCEQWAFPLNLHPPKALTPIT
jgi:hypothetical protein